MFRDFNMNLTLLFTLIGNTVRWPLGSFLIFNLKIMKSLAQRYKWIEWSCRLQICSFEIERIHALCRWRFE